MSKRLFTIAVLLAAGCGSSGKNDLSAPSTVQPQGLPPSNLPNTPKYNAPKIPGPAQNLPGPRSESAPARGSIPAGARYTIFAGRVEGDGHVAIANRLKDQMIGVSGAMKDWYVVHEANQSLLYYGYYRSIDDEKDKSTVRAQTDHARIVAMGDKMGNRPFRGAMFVELTAPDPVAPPEWNLVNAPGDCSLQIAVYMGSPERKQAAVEAVRAARAQNLEAYYFHGPSQSLVCLGHWAATAYQSTGEVKSQSRDPDQMLVVAPDLQDKKYQDNLDDLQQKQKMEVVKPHTEILDPSLKAMMLRFPHNTINGMETKRLIKGQAVYDASQLVPIPHEKPAEVVAAGPGQAGYDPSYRPVIPSQTQTQTQSGPLQLQLPKPVGGQLRSIGE